jgi:hypothetical protein
LQNLREDQLLTEHEMTRQFIMAHGKDALPRHIFPYLSADCGAGTDNESKEKTKKNDKIST